MEKILLFIHILLLSVPSLAQKQTEITFRVASYNIRYAAEADEKNGNGWSLRKGPLSDLIKRHAFDIVGTQEGNSTQLRELQQLLPEFNYLSHPYGGSGDLHNCAILYKAKLFEVMASGVFWLSQTPEVASVGWDASDRRICQWAKFREKRSGREFFVFNTHFYWRKHLAREKSGPLLAQKVASIAGTTPLILTGDLNSTPETPQIRVLKVNLKDCYEATASPRKGVEGTGFPGGVFQGIPKNRIDYIFVSPSIQVLDYQVVSDVYNDDRYPSDHLPVASTIRL